MTKHRVAVVQAGSSLFDTPRTLERMEAHCEAAARDGVELAVFPEAYVGGYPKGLDFGARIGSRTPAGRNDFLRYCAIGDRRARPGESRASALGAKDESLSRHRRDRTRRRHALLHGAVLRPVDRSRASIAS